MLATHPGIVSAPELDFFRSFVGPLVGAWQQQMYELESWGAERPWALGLPAVLTSDEFDSAVRELVATVYARLLQAKPSALVVLEKDPKYLQCVDLVRHLMPRARFIHLIRDGRDVAASLLRIAETRSAETWRSDLPVPRTAGEAALLWRSAILTGQRLAGDSSAYLELRYEDLLAAQGVDELRRALRFCGVDDRPAPELYARYSLEPGRPRDQVTSGGIIVGGEAARKFGQEPATPDDFIGTGRAGRWASSFSRKDCREFDAVAGTLLLALGYEQNPEWAGGRTSRWRRSRLDA
jgi:hypothetical protein